MKEAGHKSGFVAVVGRPSTGKSSLVNALCGHKVSIVSPTPQTTRNRIRGICTAPQGQAVFLDTPGLHNSRRRLNRHLRDLATGSLSEVDAVLYVIDTSRAAGVEERFVARLLGETQLPTIVCLNKIDLPRAAGEDPRRLIAPMLPEATVIETSALLGNGLDALREAVFAALPQGELLYPEEFYTDQDPGFRIAELIREQAMLQTREELPHALYVEISDMELREPEGDNGQLLWLRAFLIVERESQKGILVGKGGSRIKAIRQAAHREITRLFPYRIYLDLRVKVNPNWRGQEHLLTKLVR